MTLWCFWSGCTKRIYLQNKLKTRLHTGNASEGRRGGGGVVGVVRGLKHMISNVLPSGCGDKGICKNS